MKHRILYLIAVLLMIAANTTAQTITVPDYEAGAGWNETIKVNISDASEITAVQFNLSLPEGVVLDEGWLEQYGHQVFLGDAANGHSLAVKPLTSGDLLIVVYGLNLQTFNDGTLVEIMTMATDDVTTSNGRLYNVRTATVAAESKAMSDVKFTAVVETPVVEITVPEDAVYFWASSDGEVVEKGGVASGYGAGEGRVNYKNDEYYTLSINAKKENINKDYILITLDEPLKANDKIEVTAYRNKDTDANATLYYLFENGYSIDEGGEVLWNNIALNQEPNTRSYTVGEGSGSQSIKITRSKAGTNVFITKFVITRSTTDAIEKIDLNSNAVIYNLYGKQIQATSVDELPSGLYIVNGKKILVK